jgi:MFS family permease
MWAEIREGLALVWNNPTLRSLALVAAAWQVLHHMQVAVLILFATRDLGLSAGAIGLAYMAGGLGCVLAASAAERLSRRFGVGAMIVYGLLLTAFGWQAFGLIRGTGSVATLMLGVGMLLFDFGAVLYAINYLALRQALTPDRLLGRMTATMRFLTVAAAPLGSLAGGVLATGIGLRHTLWVVGSLGLVLSVAAMRWSPVRLHRALPVAAGSEQ